MRQLSKKKILAGILLLIVVIALPLAVFLLQQRQDIRQRASNSGGAKFALSAMRQVGSGLETDFSVTGDPGVDISAFDVYFEADGPLTFATTNAYTLPSSTTFEVAFSEVSTDGKQLHVILANPTDTPFTSGQLGTLHLTATGQGTGNVKIVPPTTVTGGGNTTINIDPTTINTPLTTYVPTGAPIPDAPCVTPGIASPVDGHTLNFTWTDANATQIQVSDVLDFATYWMKPIGSGTLSTDGTGFNTPVPTGGQPGSIYILGTKYYVRLSNGSTNSTPADFTVVECAPTITLIPTDTLTPIPSDSPTPTQPASTDTPTPTQPAGTSPTVTIIDTFTSTPLPGSTYALNLSFPLRGITASPSATQPLTPTRNIVVCLYPLTFDTATDPLCQSQQARVINGTVTYDAGLRQFVNNTFNLNVPANTYQFLVKADRYLRTKLSNNLVLPTTPDATAIQVNTVTPLISGDVNGDNEINITDWNILRDCGALAAKNPPSMALSTASDPYKSKACQDHATKGMGSNPAFENADLNNDGFVNTFDYQQFSYGISSIKGN